MSSCLIFIVLLTLISSTTQSWYKTLQNFGKDMEKVFDNKVYAVKKHVYGLFSFGKNVVNGPDKTKSSKEKAVAPTYEEDIAFKIHNALNGVKNRVEKFFADTKRPRKLYRATPPAKQGKTDGKAEGKTESETEDKTEGKTEGKTDGKTEDKTEGNTDGKTEGKTEGITEGKTEGKTEGITEGITEVNSENSNYYHPYGEMVAALSSEFLERTSRDKSLLHNLKLEASRRFSNQVQRSSDTSDQEAELISKILKMELRRRIDQILLGIGKQRNDSHLSASEKNVKDHTVSYSDITKPNYLSSPYSEIEAELSSKEKNPKQNLTNELRRLVDQIHMQSEKQGSDSRRSSSEMGAELSPKLLHSTTTVDTNITHELRRLFNRDSEKKKKQSRYTRILIGKGTLPWIDRTTDNYVKVLNRDSKKKKKQNRFSRILIGKGTLPWMDRTTGNHVKKRNHFNFSHGASKESNHFKHTTKAIKNLKDRTTSADNNTETLKGKKKVFISLFGFDV